jgi:diguanylate cyclase (GGDEF)-like protein/PAS domain S-box-containing protein
LGISVIVLLGYITRLATAYSWRPLTGVSILASIGFVILGLGLGVFAFPEGSVKHRRWYPFSVGFGLFTAVLLLWQSLVSWSHQVVGQLASWADEVEALLLPAANIILLIGILLTGWVIFSLSLAQRFQLQSEISQRLNQELQQSQALLKATFEATEDGLMVLDVQGRRLRYNQKFAQIWGFSEALSAQLQDLGPGRLPPHMVEQLKDPTGFLAATRQMMAALDQNSFDVFELQDGRILERHGHPYWLGDRPMGKVLSYRDVTERNLATQRLQESEARFRSAFDDAAVGMALVSLAGRWLHVNPALCCLLGYPQSKLLGQRVLEVTHPEDQKIGPLDLLQALTGGQAAVQLEKRYLSQQGEVIWALLNVSLVRNIDGTPRYFVAQIQDITARKQAELALRNSEARFHAFMNHSPAVAFMKDEQGCYVYANHTLEQNFQVSAEFLLGKTDFDWLPEPVATAVRKNDQVVLSANETSSYLETVPSPDGQKYYWLTFKFPFQDPQGRRYVGGVAFDITDRQRLEEALFRERELAQVTLESIGDAVITTDATGDVTYLNPVAAGLTAWRQEDAQGLPLSMIFNILHEETRQPAENPVVKALQTGEIVSLANHTVLIAKDGREIAIEDSAAPIRDRRGDVVGAVMVFHDVTQSRNLSRQVSWQAMHDSLTGLVNRHEFERRLVQAVNGARFDQQCHVLCYLDLDQFKIVNDTCGHVAGDELLCQVTKLLQQKIRKTDTLARLGGDEFGILLNQCPLEQAIKTANTLRRVVEAFRFVWQGNTFTLGVSLGVVAITAKSGNVSDLLVAADAACYAAKNSGRNRVHVFEPNDQALIKQQGEMRWVNRLSQALEENRFLLYVQPITATVPTEIAVPHAEVLLRLKDETGQLVAPMAFIPAAERYNLMHKIDRWVINQLCRHWSSLAVKPCIYGINLSGASINDPQFLGFVQAQFAEHAVVPNLICFEITETVAIANLTKASELMRQLQQLGCRFALDDFGSGMSSFAYLKNLPVDYLKIDGGFIKNILNDPIDDAMVAAIIRIGHVMGIQTIAEFVENKDILQRIKALGVDYAQGYGIASPYPLAYHEI